MTIQINHHHYFHGFPDPPAEISSKLDRILTQQDQLKQGETQIMADLSKLTAAINKLQSDVTAALAAQSSDQAAIDALTASVTDFDNSLPGAAPANPAPGQP
jgi:hypothetical protein